MSKVRLGIIGIGNMGSGHVESILDGKVPEIELAAVADQREVRRQWARETVPETVKIFETAEELLDDSDLDAVLVAVPHYDHPRYVIQALRRGFHVMCSGDERGGKQTRSGIRHDVQSENEPYLPEDA